MAIKRREVTQITMLCMQRCTIGFQFPFYLHVPVLALCLCSCYPHSANPPLLSPVCWNGVQLFNHSSETNQHLFGGRPGPGHCRPAANTPPAANLTPCRPDEKHICPHASDIPHPTGELHVGSADSKEASIQVLFKDLMSAAVVILERFLSVRLLLISLSCLLFSPEKKQCFARSPVTSAQMSSWV